VRVRSLILPAVAAIVGGALALALVHSRGGSSRSPSNVVASRGASRLKIANYAFDPPGLTVRAGTTVTVTNTDSAPHTATARSGAFDSGTLRPGHTAHFTLTKPGTYTYFCQFHAFMTGTITVDR
jgi:plastocyanin